jgi:hypothetical protein
MVNSSGKALDVKVDAGNAEVLRVDNDFRAHEKGEENENEKGENWDNEDNDTYEYVENLLTFFLR